MTSRDRFESQLDELEHLVIQRARGSRPQYLPSESATLEAIHKRIAALPITGIPSIEIPDIPTAGPTTLITGASGKAAAAAKGAAATLPLPSIPMTAWITVGQFKLAATAVAIVGSTVVGTGLIPAERAAQDSTAPQHIPAEVGEVHARPNIPSYQESRIESKKSAVQAAFRSDVERPALTSSRRENKTNSPALATNPISVSNVPGARLGAPISFEAGSGDQSRPTQTSEEPADMSPGRPRAPTLTGELEQLRRAQQALQKGEPARALQAMLELDREASAGALYPEKQIIKVLALCALKRNAEAESLAQHLIASSGGVVYSSRLRNSCVSRSTTADQ